LAISTTKIERRLKRTRDVLNASITRRSTNVRSSSKPANLLIEKFNHTLVATRGVSVSTRATG
jgi:hypothetical protein